ncbi:PEGA domain-containing protein [Methanococcus maripaludis]|uniref:PEGA domain-containing protein n=1 Tax=Methanococcus maripaludis OS7 TaxID=637915 RepID=A0A2Z5PHK6_METMI|nr:PEGA domain-containing protein [Methanococcus maripaludis]BAP62133.1 hypothetical protein MMOS7_00470 [Methanococcus maripaludis OS7]
MKKSYLLFLLLLLSVVGSVNATAVTIPETCTVTSNYVVLNEELDTNVTKALLLTYSWNDYTSGSIIPTISGVDGNIIYFSDVDSLARFCSIISGTSPSLAFDGNYKIFKSGAETYATCILVNSPTPSASGTYLNNITMNLESTQLMYTYGYYLTTLTGNTGTVLYNSYQIWTQNSGGICDFSSLTANQEGIFTVSQKWSGSSVTMVVSVLVFDYVDYTTSIPDGSNAVVSELLSPPTLYDLTINTNVDGLTVYNGETVLGSADDGTVFPLIAGTYDLTFEKDGYWNETETVIITDSGVSVDLEMFPDSELYLISSNVTTQNIVTNMDVVMTLHIEPKVESQNTMISFSKEIVSIKEGTEELTKDGDNYIIGDFYEPIDLTVTFNSGTLTGNRYIETTVFGTAYVGTQSTDFSTIKSITYAVNSLPIIVYMPDWESGVNELRITEQEGNTLILNVEVLDSSDDSVFTQNVVFNPYGVETLDINLTEGIYYLHLYCTDFDTSIPFTVSAASTTDDDSDITGVIVTGDDSLVDLLYDYWYVPVALGIAIGVYFVFSKKKGKKPSKLKGGKNGKK